MNFRGNRCGKFKILNQGLVCCRSERIPWRGLLLWNSKSTANMSFRCSQVLGNPFLNAAPKTVRVLQLQHVWERPMNFFPSQECRGTGPLFPRWDRGRKARSRGRRNCQLKGKTRQKAKCHKRKQSRLSISSLAARRAFISRQFIYTKQCEFLHFLQNFHNERRPVILSSVTFFRYPITSFVTAGSEYRKS